MRRSSLSKAAVERVGLRAVAREAVEDEAVAAVLGADAVDDQVDDELVGHQLAAVHVALRGDAQLGAVLHRGAQDVAGCHVGQAKVVLQAGGLRAFAGTRRPEEDEVQLAHERGKVLNRCAATRRGTSYFRKPS